MQTISKYLDERFLNRALHNPIIDEAERTATFYLWNMSGSLIGYQQHRPDAGKTNYQRQGPKAARYFTYRKQPTVSVWGLESIYAFKGPIFLCEGVFDACRMTYLQRPALASCCNDPPKDLWNWLDCLQRPIVAVCDGDKAGRKLAKFGHYVEFTPDGYDLGDAPTDYVSMLIKKYSQND